MEIPVVINFYIKPSSNSTIIRSIVLKEYFAKLTSNVEVLYPCQVYHGLLLCKSKRTEEKILNMRHILSDGSILQLSQLPQQLFQPIKCSIDGHFMQINEINTSLQQAVPFLHAAGGKIQVNSDRSMILEGHIFIVNSIHSFLIHKLSKIQSSSSLDTLELRSGTIAVKMMPGKLLEQNVEGVLIPVNDKYKIHKTFERELQALGGINLLNYFKEFSNKGSRIHEGELIFYPNRDLKIPAKFIILFTVPRLSSNKDRTTIDAFQSNYEQIIYRMFQTIDQKSISSLALPVLEPYVKHVRDRCHANEMTIRAMLNAVRQFSRTNAGKLKRISIIDRRPSIRRMSRRVRKYQTQSSHRTTMNNHPIVDIDDAQSFTHIFGVPRIPEIVSSTSDSDDEDNEGEEHQLPYVDHAKS